MLRKDSSSQSSYIGLIFTEDSVSSCFSMAILIIGLLLARQIPLLLSVTKVIIDGKIQQMKLSKLQLLITEINEKIGGKFTVKHLCGNQYQIVGGTPDAVSLLYKLLGDVTGLFTQNSIMFQAPPLRKLNVDVQFRNFAQISHELRTLEKNYIKHMSKLTALTGPFKSAGIWVYMPDKFSSNEITGKFILLLSDSDLRHDLYDYIYLFSVEGNFRIAQTDDSLIITTSPSSKLCIKMGDQKFKSLLDKHPQIGHAPGNVSEPSVVGFPYRAASKAPCRTSTRSVSLNKPKKEPAEPRPRTKTRKANDGHVYCYNSSCPEESDVAAVEHDRGGVCFFAYSKVFNLEGVLPPKERLKIVGPINQAGLVQLQKTEIVHCSYDGRACWKYKDFTSGVDGVEKNRVYAGLAAMSKEGEALYVLSTPMSRDKRSKMKMR